MAWRQLQIFVDCMVVILEGTDIIKLEWNLGLCVVTVMFVT